METVQNSVAGPWDNVMRRAIALARHGEGSVEPNPLVGAVVVAPSGEVVGEGWHERFGGPHAEVVALARAGARAAGATLVVTLEPCCHFGKTPPCTRAVLAAEVKRVVVGTRDPFPKVAGGGLAELRAAGLDVVEGCLESEVNRLLAPFRTWVELRRPYVHAKWAMTLDGKIASATGASQWISNESSRRVVHALRGRMDAILVGVGTALADDPLLTARPPGPRTAVRVVVDRLAQLPVTSQLVSTARDIPTLVYHTAEAPTAHLDRLRSAGVETIVVGTELLANSATTKISLPAVLHDLAARQVTNLLVEGGAQVFGSLRDARLIDEVHAFIAPGLMGGATAPGPIAGTGAASPDVMPRLVSPQVEQLADDLYLHGPVLWPVSENETRD
jgi:diaminohydroxyphosphoribosylaminopyrimidine deaminase / 5-amino-6-(5-phosphoribosylamino)uracil reductase